MTVIARQRGCLCLVLLALLHRAHTFYVPLQGPTNFCRKEVWDLSRANCKPKVSVYANKLDSVKTLVPYDYASFDFCPLGAVVPAENLGQVVFGERLRTASYDIDFTFNNTGKLLCGKNYSSGSHRDEMKLQFFRERIHEDYTHQWVIDNMPVTWCYFLKESDKPVCTTHFPIGCYVSESGRKHGACFLSKELSEPGATYIFNHIHLILAFRIGTNYNGHTDGRIVRAQVQLASCQNVPCSHHPRPMKLPKFIPKDGFKLLHSYSVKYIEKEGIHWASRWNYILDSQTLITPNLPLILFNSILTPTLLSILLGVILLRFLCRFLCRFKYHDQTLTDPWMWAHSDVSRPPSCIMLLSACVGSGFQLLSVTFITLLFACFGILSPPNRGATETAVLVLSVLMGVVAGYASARLYKGMGGLHWKGNLLVTALFVPGIVFLVCFFLNLLLWVEGSSAALPFTTMLALLCLWFGISLPLTFAGGLCAAHCCCRKPVIPEPMGTEHTLYKTQNTHCKLTHPIPSSLIGGILPFCSVMGQLVFAFDSLWSNQIIYMPGLFMLGFVILAVVCAETAIMLCYFQFCSENYNWRWQSFFATGTMAFYLFLYSLFYCFYCATFTGALSYVLYFGYTFIIVFLFFILTGTIGFWACLLFVKRVHSFENRHMTVVRTTVVTSF